MVPEGTSAALFTANPANLYEWHLWAAAAQAGVDPSSCVALISVIYKILVFDPKDLAAS